MHFQAETRGSYKLPSMGMASPAADPLSLIESMAAENAVVIFSVSTCCMCHAVKRLFRGMGVSPAVHELDLHPFRADIQRALLCLLGGAGVGGLGSPAAAAPLPVVFIGGKLVGSMERVMASHINGSLVPLLKEAGALWL